MKLRHLFMATATALSLGHVASAADPDLVVFDWAGFEDQNLIQTYVEKYGQMPTYALFGDDDEAFQKVSSGFKADVAHPCSQMISKYRDAGLIVPWDVSRIPEYKNIDAKFLNSKVFVDSGTVWYIPTDFGYTAIGYNKDKVPEADVSTLQVFLDPKYQGRVSLPDNTDDVWALALLATGVTDWSGITEDQFQAAAAWLRKAHQNVRAYWADPSELSQLMASGEVLIAWNWNDTVALLQEENFPIGFQRQPKEGASSWFCGWVHFKDAPGSSDKAYDFINAWTEPRSAQALLEDFGYVTTNDVALSQISKDDLEKHHADPVTGIQLAQTPLDQKMRDRMVEEFEKIKAGF